MRPTEPSCEALCPGAAELAAFAAGTLAEDLNRPVSPAKPKP